MSDLSAVTKQGLSGPPLAPFATLAMIYGRVVRQLSPVDFHRYCVERCSLARKPG